MVFQFTLQDLMLFLAGVLGIAVGILLVSVLWKIKKVVGTLQALLETNQESIKKTVSTMPGIFDNVGQISINVRDTTDKLKISVPVILQEVESVTNAAKGSIELAGAVIENAGSGINETISAYKRETSSIMNYFQIIEEILEIICRVFSSSKQTQLGQQNKKKIMKHIVDYRDNSYCFMASWRSYCEYYGWIDTYSSRNRYNSYFVKSN